MIPLRISGEYYIISPFIKPFKYQYQGPSILTASSEYLATWSLSVTLSGSNILKQRKELNNFRSTYLKFPHSYIPRIAESIWEEKWKKIIDQKDNPIPYIMTVVKNMTIAEYKKVQSLFEEKKKEIKCPVCYEKQSAKNKLCKKCGADLVELDKWGKIDRQNFLKSLYEPAAPGKDPLIKFISKGDKSKEEIQKELTEILDLKMWLEKINLNPYATQALLVQKMYQIPSFRQAYIRRGLPEKYYFAAKKDKERKSHLFQQFFI